MALAVVLPQRGLIPVVFSKLVITTRLVCLERLTAQEQARPALYNASGTGNTFVLNETAVIIGSISAGNAASNNTLALSEHADFELTVGGSPNEGELGQGTGPGQWTYQVSNGGRLRSAQRSDGQKVEFVAVDVSNCAAGEQHLL